MKQDHTDDKIFVKSLPIELQSQIQGSGSKFGGYEIYADCYIEAGKILYKKYCYALKHKDFIEIDQICIPLLYILRHGIELYLKEILTFFYRDRVENATDEKEKKEIKFAMMQKIKEVSHDLIKSWNVIEGELNKINPNLRCCPKEKIISIRNRLTEINEFDESSERFRYPVSKKGESNTEYENLYLSEKMFAIDLKEVYKRICILVKELEMLRYMVIGNLKNVAITELKYIKYKKAILDSKEKIVELCDILKVEISYKNSNIKDDDIEDILLNEKRRELSNAKTIFVERLKANGDSAYYTIANLYHAISNSGYKFLQENQELDFILAYKKAAEIDEKCKKVIKDYYDFLIEEINQSGAKYLLNVFQTALYYIDILEKNKENCTSIENYIK